MADRSPSLRTGVLLAGWMAVALPSPGYGATAPAHDANPDAGGDAQQAPGSAAGEGATLWRVPPIDYWGTLSYENRFDTGGQQPQTMQQLLTAKVNGSSYLWKPWFAEVNGGLGISFGRFDNSDIGSGTNDVFLTGIGQAQFFPRSRFPFEAHFELADSRVGGGIIAANDYRTLRVGVSQSYRPESGPYTLYGSYDHWSQFGPVYGNSSQDLVSGEYRSSWKDQSLQVTANLNLAQSATTGQETEFDALVARHNYGPSPEFSVDTTASLVRNRYDLLLGSSDIAGAQVNSIGVWRPANQPLTVTASARIGALRVSGGAGDSQGATATLGATYQVNRNLQLSASGNAGFFNGAGTRSTSHGENVGGIYSGDNVSFAGFSYDWSVSANAGYQGEPTGSAALLSSQLNQSLGRALVLPDGSTLSGSVGLNLGAGKGSASSDRFGDNSGNVGQVGTNASLTWNKSAGGSSGYARVTVSDTRQVYGEQRPSFQFANVQISGTWNFGRYNSLVGDLTYQYTRQDPGFLIAGGAAVPVPSIGLQSSTATAANITYRHDRVFGIPRLRFVSQLQITDAAVVQQNVLGAPQDQLSRWWDNRLEYLIGRLTATFAVRAYEVQGIRREGIYLRIERAIGGSVGTF